MACPPFNFSTISQPTNPADAATNVFTRAWTAWPFAAPAEPALNPNHPNQRIAVQIKTIDMLCGGDTSLGQPLLFPKTNTKARAATPEFK